MPWRLSALCLSLLLLAATTDPACARWGSSSGGGHSRSSGGKHTPPGTWIERKCKTDACFRKHPSGSYGFYSGKRR